MSAVVAVSGGTSIEWADFSFNPWWGCEKVSPGCAHCYAEGEARRRAVGQQLWGEGHGFKLMAESTWRKPLAWARNVPAKLGRRPRVFCASMADVFEERPELDEHRRRLFDLIAATPELDWLLLTKRPEFAADWLGGMFFDGEAWPNVWMGVSIENSRFTWRADVLRQIPAAVRFISAEPLLGSLYPQGGSKCVGSTRFGGSGSGGLVGEASAPTAATSTSPTRSAATASAKDATSTPTGRAPLDLTGIDWVIVGGESGPAARPMRQEWAVEVVWECFQSGAAPFVKQLGAVLGRELAAGGKGQDFARFPPELRFREFPRGRA